MKPTARTQSTPLVLSRPKAKPPLPVITSATGSAELLKSSPPESQAEFDALREGLLAEYRPVLPTEKMLADEMVEHEWRSRRTEQIMDGLISEGATADPKALAIWLRYQTYYNRAMDSKTAARELANQVKSCKL